MTNQKKEDLEKMYALRAGLSVISKTCDDIDVNRMTLKKKQLNLREIKELCYYLYYGYVDNIEDIYSKGDKYYYNEIMSETYYDDITLKFEQFMMEETGTLLAFEDLQKDYKKFTKTWLSKRKNKEEIVIYEKQIRQNQKAIENLKTEYKDKENEMKVFENKVKQENKVLEKVNINLSDKLISTYNNLLDFRDWENLDLIIYYFETGRADSIKEALQIVDKERLNNALIEAIGVATNEICRSIHSLGNIMIAGFSSLAAQLEAQRVQTMGALQQIDKNISGVLTQQTLSNALLAKANVSSKEMVEQMKKLNLKVK